MHVCPIKQLHTCAPNALQWMMDQDQRVGGMGKFSDWEVEVNNSTVNDDSPMRSRRWTTRTTKDWRLTTELEDIIIWK